MSFQRRFNGVVNSRKGTSRTAASHGPEARISIVVFYLGQYVIMDKSSTFDTLLSTVRVHFDISRKLDILSYIRTPNVFNLPVSHVQLHESYYHALADGVVVYFMGHGELPDDTIDKRGSLDGRRTSVEHVGGCGAAWPVEPSQRGSVISNNGSGDCAQSDEFKDAWGSAAFSDDQIHNASNDGWGFYQNDTERESQHTYANSVQSRRV